MRRILALVAALALPGAALSAGADPAAIDRGSEIAYRRALAADTARKSPAADAATAQRLRRIVNRLVAAGVTVDPASRGFRWETSIRVDPVPDVRAYPGGRLLVNEGLGSRTGMKDDEVAAILAFAIANVLLGHDVARAAPSAVAAAPSPDPNREALAWADAIAASMRTPRYAAPEIEAADRMSAELMARAAYDPRALGSAWRQLARANEGIVLAAPVTDARLAAMDASGRAAVPLYEEAQARAAAAPPPIVPPTGAPPRGGPIVR
jgi:predicted Zn-dependent protease